ncbi:MAG: aromatic ring-hydroxylating dioxygenase subunit alpha [Gammaproteobacteria bacterium]|nr:aromatic ring-hydroxylating dioxygenase subunit alpha [Gammaproteobacteria bacterium]MYD75048.1 aromatic ring-hydroxylating dioxygenase subunit alpha [Gammaproteobacteria bacterium]
MSVDFESFWNTDPPFRTGLPPETYTSSEFFELENRTLFRTHWIFVGYRHELNRVGDVVPVTVAGQPVLLVAGGDLEIRAFHNLCRHRCLKLVDAPKNCGRLIRCPYHSWSYGLDGKLKAAPHFGGKETAPPKDFSPADFGLHEIECAVWNDWIFVCLGPPEMSFPEFIAPLERQLENVPLHDLKPIGALDFGTVNTNWKTLMENFIEPYHVQFVHRSTTSQPLTDHYTIIDRHCLGSGCDIADDGNTSKSETLAVSSRFLTLFPNFVIGLYEPDQIGVHLNSPVNAGQTCQRRIIYVHKDNPISDGDIEKTRSLWHQIHQEDHEICERLQQGRASPAADGGILSPHWENSLRNFQEYLARAVDPASSRDRNTGSTRPT